MLFMPSTRRLMCWTRPKDHCFPWPCLVRWALRDIKTFVVCIVAWGCLLFPNTIFCNFLWFHVTATERSRVAYGQAWWRLLLPQEVHVAISLFLVVMATSIHRANPFNRCCHASAFLCRGWQSEDMRFKCCLQIFFFMVALFNHRVYLQVSLLFP